MNNFRVIIAGGRDFCDYELLREKCDNILSSIRLDKNIIIVSGHARGADSLGERYACEHGYAIDSHPADWERHGKAAGHIRNAEMADAADAIIAFWDGKSRGTANMINLATQKNLKVRIIKY